MAAAETSFFKEMVVVKLLFLLMLLPEAAISSGQNWSSGGMSNVEDEYLKWIKHMGSFRHSLFEKAKNKFKPCLTLKVSKKPKAGAFRSVQKAINSLPVVNRCRVVIRVGAGTYREKVEIPATMSYIWVDGEGAEKTIIEWDDTADHMGENGRPLGTFASATFAVNSPFFIARNVTFKNKATLPPSGALGKQAVAFRISADAAAFIRCKFIGAQDTLYDHIGRHYFKDCYIEGSVDFVFGDGLSIYDGCHLHAISNSYGALTAQKRNSLLEETGFSFVNCRVSGSGALYLGRAWGSFSRVVFAYTFMDKIITPTGWYNWGDKNREIKKRQRLKRRRTWVITLDAGLCFMDNTGVRDQELIMEDEFPGRENSLSRRPTRFSLLILSMQTNGFQRTSITPLNDIESVVF